MTNKENIIKAIEEDKKKYLEKENKSRLEDKILKFGISVAASGILAFSTIYAFIGKDYQITAATAMGDIFTLYLSIHYAGEIKNHKK